MSTASITYTASVDNTTVTKSSTVTTDRKIVADPSIAAAKVGSLTTRTDNTTGTLTMNSGHGFTTGCRLDIYWAGGSRRGVTAGTVATNSVPISGGSGDNLPAAATAITAMIPTHDTFVVTTSALAALFGRTPAPNATAMFYESDGTTLVATLQLTPTTGYIWDGTGTNPFATGDVASVYLSHSDSTGARQVAVTALAN